ncbi:hypothetical protein Dtox_3149 [Desulfofarcimen acetoxidans DSM 771]|uniref:Uncharacterized protein n=1 Tax=Desulfofarcimen acetoxidans (strain ATCC 49208 / DSM 771 / KCTC 5769 / VKM B-1644 / 5575) TaxID=485916 RepID=C8W4K8_DESAS|nr:hypothetical protein [Desulfofarcimen acetoxidans]ACV63894.1 hypothetical protein Dtox_3149 [Desulfofarcimen acetoxidans DSM 771]
MADQPFSVRLETEVKDKLTALIEQSNTTAKEFVGRLISTYEAAKMHESTVQVRELKQLRHFLSRIEEMYIAMYRAGQDRQEIDTLKITQAQDEATQAKAAVHEAQERAARAIEEANARAEAAVNESAAYKTQISDEMHELKQAVLKAIDDRDQANRLASLAEKTAADAEAKASELKDSAEHATEYKRELEQAVQQREQLIAQHQLEVNALQQHVNQLQAEIERKDSQMPEALSRAAERAEIDKEKAVLAAQREAMDEIGRLREALALAREERAVLEVELSKAKNISAKSKSQRQQNTVKKQSDNTA